LFVKPQSVLVASQLRKDAPGTPDPSGETSPLADG
jgi:hypothetical protein